MNTYKCTVCGVVDCKSWHDDFNSKVVSPSEAPSLPKKDGTFAPTPDTDPLDALFKRGE